MTNNLSEYNCGQVSIVVVGMAERVTRDGMHGQGVMTKGNG